MLPFKKLRFGLASSLGLCSLLQLVPVGLWAQMSREQPPATKLAPWQRILLGKDRDRVQHLEADFEKLRDAGKYREALPLAQEILAIRTRSQGADHWATVLARWRVKTTERVLSASYFDLAKLAVADNQMKEAERLWNQGRCAEAEPLQRQAMAVGRQVLTEEYPLYADGIEMLAMILASQGKDKEAELLNREALRLRQRTLGPECPDVADSYEQLAQNLDNQGAHVEAEPLWRQTLHIRQQALGEEHPDTAAAYYGRALNLRYQGRHAKAVRLFAQALDLNRRTVGERSTATAFCYNGLACTLDDQGKWAEAEPLFRKSLALYREGLGDKHLSTAAVSRNLAFCLYVQGKYAAAEETWTLASKSFEATRSAISYSGLGRAPYAARQSPAPLQAAVLRRQGKLTEAWQSLEADQGRGLLDDLSARQLRPLTAQERTQEQKLLDQLEQVNKQVEVLHSLKNPSAEQRRQADHLVNRRDALYGDFGQLEQELVRKYGVAVGKIYGLTEVQKHIPADAALLAWLDITGAAWTGTSISEHWACLVRREGPPEWVKLSGQGLGGAWTSEDLEVVERFRLAVSSQPGVFREDRQEITRRFVAQRLKPLEPYLGARGNLLAVRHLVVLPGRPLAGIPIEAGMDQYTVSYAPSATLFAWLQEARAKVAGAGPDGRPMSLLALGDPVYERPKSPPSQAKSGAAASQRADVLLRGAEEGNYLRLPGTAVEVQVLSKLFPRSVVLLESAASEQALDQLAGSGELGHFRFLHFATHAEIDPHRTLQSRLILARDRLPDPLKQVLAGRRIYDGRLTAEHILRAWKLDADLVVLSACQSALGKQAGGEGFLGFGQALFLAGARSLVLSLWKVDDTATALLMTRFYQNLLGKRLGLKGPLPKAEALREAKLWLRGLTASQVKFLQAELQAGRLGTEPALKRAADADAEPPYAHPHYWAAFILIGDPY
jgi:tetratricopeptide (TPR) repeat protein